MPPSVKDSRPLLVQAGRHLIDPSDVSQITETKPGLYVVRLKSNPNPTFATWVEEKDIHALLACFKVVAQD